MSRSIQPPGVSTRTIDRFLGMVSDRSGVEIDENEFTDLVNCRNDYLRRISKRKGAGKYNNLTHTGASTPTRGLDRFVTEAGSEIDLKAVSTVVYKSADGAAWASLQTSLTDARTFFASTLTKKTGASADETDTVDSSTPTTVTATSLSMTIGEHVNKILVINNENKRIVANTATKITVAERFDVTPSVGDSFTVVDSQKECFFANGTNFYKTDGTTNTRLDNSVYAYAFTGVTEHMNRLWGWKDETLYYSDIGAGEHFSRNALFDYGSDVQIAKPFGDLIGVWESGRVTAIEGDNPDNFRQLPVSPNRGTDAPFSVATWGGMQFGLNKDVGVLIISAQPINPGGPEPVSISDEYVTNRILNHTKSDLNNACAEVKDSKYYLRVGADLYICHLRESMKAPRDDAGNIRWIWTRDEYPAAIQPYVLRLLGNKLAAGSEDDGQVYELEQGPQQAAAIFSDTFTESTDTELSAHTPDTGTSWTKVVGIVAGSTDTGSGSDLGIEESTDTLHATASTTGAGDADGAIYSADATYSSANYEAEVVSTAGDTDDDYSIIAVRMADTNNFYAFEWTTGAGKLWKRVAGTDTQLGTDTGGVADGEKVTLRCFNNTITVFIAGQVAIEVEDESLSAAGKAGLGMGGAITVTGDVSAQQLDSFNVYPLDDDDDGTAFTWTIEKRDWRPRTEESQIFFWSIKWRQQTTQNAVTMSLFGDPDGNTYGSAIGTVALASATKNLHEIKFTSNPTDEKAKGNTLSYKITEAGSVQVPPIEEIHLLYVPNPVG